MSVSGRFAIAFPSQLCHDRGMLNEKPKASPESKFAEVIRKGKEKRRGMEQQSEQRENAKLESLAREDSNEAGPLHTKIKDSEM